MKLKNYTRRPFSVDAVQVTVENFKDVATLVKGEVQYDNANSDKIYIDVPVKRPQSPRHKRAYIGDWIVYYQRGWKVYTDKAFTTTFQSTVEVSNDLAGFAARENGVTNQELTDLGDCLRDFVSESR